MLGRALTLNCVYQILKGHTQQMGMWSPDGDYDIWLKAQEKASK